MSSIKNEVAPDTLKDVATVTSKQDKNIYKRIIEFQSNMSNVAKDANNPFFKSKYAPLDTIQQMIKKPLSDAGLGYTQYPTSEGLKTVLFDENGNTLEGSYPMVLTGKPQEVGSAMTYAKRYSLVGILGIIVGGDDDDGNLAQQQVQKFIGVTQFEAIKDVINTKGLDEARKIISEFASQGIQCNAKQMQELKTLASKIKDEPTATPTEN
jgi:ERF superfamily